MGSGNFQSSAFHYTPRCKSTWNKNTFSTVRSWYGIYLTAQTQILIFWTSKVLRWQLFSWSSSKLLASLEDTAATQSSAAYELRLYRESPSETNIDKYPLRFWQINQAVYPRLSKLAMQYLCPPASSVPVECLFSAAGELISKKRNSLASHNANTLLLLHCWLQDYH